MADEHSLKASGYRTTIFAAFQNYANNWRNCRSPGLRRSRLYQLRS